MLFFTVKFFLKDTISHWEWVEKPRHEINYFKHDLFPPYKMFGFVHDCVLSVMVVCSPWLECGRLWVRVSQSAQIKDYLLLLC